MKSLSVPERHQKNIAIKTLKMNDVMARIMGGMSKDEAREFLKSIGYTDAQVRKMEASQTSRRAFVASELLKLAKELVSRDKKEECPVCGKMFDLSELDYDERKHVLRCPDDGAAVIENYREPKETRP